MGDDPPYLAVGTEVSAKYKGAFCEAKIRKVVRIVKCKVTFKSGLGTTLVSDDQIKGTLRVGANVEAKHAEKNQFVDATINKIQDCSQYTVVFDDGDITTLRRSALCLKSGRHFNESETLDQLPLTHPEHFSNPVVGGRRGVRRRNINTDNDKEDSSDDEDVPAKKGRKKNDREPDMGKVVCVESTDKKKTKDSWFPALVVSPSAQETVRIRTKDDYLVRSFRDGRYYTVPKKETKDFKEVADKLESNSNVLRTAVEKATNYLEKNELPPHWDRDILFGQGNTVNEESNNSDEQQSDSDSSEDDTTEEKDRFVAQLYKFMDDRGSPINKVPLVCNKDLELYKLYKIVKTFGGYNKVTNGSQWKLVTIKMGYGNMPSTSTINLVKQSYKKCVYHYEEFNRKLGCTMNSRAVPTTKSRSSRQFFREKHASGSTKDMKKDEPEETAKKEEEKDKKSVSSGDVETEPPVSDSDTKKSEQLEDSRRSRSRQESRSRTKEPEEIPEKQPKTPIKKKRVSLKEKEKEAVKEEPSSPAVVPKKGGRGKKKETEEETEKSEPEEVLNHIADNVLVDVGHKLLVYYGPQSEKKVVYEAKVLKTNMKTKSFLVHYTGWNTRYDEWIKRGRISENLTFKPDQGKPAQGRGPAGYAETTESESSSSTKASTKSPKRKPRAIPSTPTAASGTRSKSGISRRKRFSGESEIIKRRKTRQKSDQVVVIPSVSGSDNESSDSEDKAVPIVSTPPSSVSSASSAHVSKGGNLEKRNEDDDASSSSTSSSSIIKLTKDNGEKDKDKQNQVIDLNQIRSEMKGLDKMVKSSATPTPPAAPTPPLAVSELKLDIYDFQDDTIDAPKLKMFAPRSPDKKEEKSESVTPVKQVVSPDIVDQGKEREALRQAAEAEKSASVAEAKDNIKSESMPDADKVKEEVSRPLTPKVTDTETANQATELQTPGEKPSVAASSSTPKVKTSTQSAHILKVTTSAKSKGNLSQTPRQRSPVAAVAHPPPPPLVHSSGVIVTAKSMTAPLVQVRPPMLIQRPPASLATGSLVRLAVPGTQEIPVRLPAKVETVAAPPSTSLKTEGKAGLFSMKSQEIPHPAQEASDVLSTSPPTVATVVEPKEAGPTKILATTPNQTVSEPVAKPTSFTPKVGSVGKEKKHVVLTQIIDSTVAMTSSLASSQTPATPASTTAKKKKKEVISKKFVESDSDSSKEAESPKKVIKRRQRSETPKKGAPPAKKKKLDLTEGRKPVTKTTRAVKGRPPNKKSIPTTSAKTETEKTRSLPVHAADEQSEKVHTENIEERGPDAGAVSPDIVAERVSPVKHEKYLERLEKHVDKEKALDNVEKEVGPKQSKQMEKKEKDRENAEKEAGSKLIKHIEDKDQVTENLEKDILVIPKQNKQSLEEEKPIAQVEKPASEVEKKCKVPEKKDVEKSLDKKDKTGEKTAEKKEKVVEKHVEKKEKNIDRKEKTIEKKEKNTEKSVEKKEKNAEKHVDKKDKNVEKHSDKKEKTTEKILDKKDKPMQKTDKNIEKSEKGAGKKHVEKKDKKAEKAVEKKEKSSEIEKKIDKKEKGFETEKKLEKREKIIEKEKSVDRKEKEIEKDKGAEKIEKSTENLERNVDKGKSVDHLERIGEKVKETVQKHEKLIDKPAKHIEKQGKKFEKTNKSTIERATKPDKLSKSFEKQKLSDKLIKTIEIDVSEKSSKPSDKQSKESEKLTKQSEKREKLPEKQAAKKEIKKDRESLIVSKNEPGQTPASLESKISADSDVAMKKSCEQLPIKEESKNVGLPIKVESNLPELPLMNPCSIDLSGSAKALEKIPILPTISVTIPSKVMSLNLVDLADKKIETPTMFFTSKAVDINSGKTEVSAAHESSPSSPLSVEKEVPMSLVSDEVIAKSPEPENEDEMENLKLKSSEKQETPVQDDLPCGLLLCEEIIPGSPAAGDDSSRFSFEDELNEEKTSKSTSKTINVAQSKPVEDPVVEDVTNTRFVDEKPEQEVRTEGVPVEDKHTRSLILEKEETNKSASEEQRNSFNTQQDTPQSIETTPPMTPEIASGSSISSGSPRIDLGSQSPLAARGSSKSKESSDGDEDISEFPKGNDNDDNYLSNETGGKTSKASNSSIASSTKRTRLSEPRNSRNISPPAKRRRIIRRKSPEEVVRSYPYRGRSSTGRKSQTGSSNDSQDHHKAMPPPPPINLGRPPRSSRFNFIPELDASMDSEQRIELINQAIQDLREKYISVKSEMLSFERRRKRWKRREREKAVAERAARQEANRLNS